MGTRANIIVKHPEKDEYAGIYTHWDGYPSHHGRILLDNYTTYETVYQLIQLGDLSELHPTPDTCVSYHIWRNEPLKINLSPTLSEQVDQGYAYLFKDGAWFLKSYNFQWKLLTDSLCQTG